VVEKRELGEESRERKPAAEIRKMKRRMVPSKV